MDNSLTEIHNDSDISKKINWYNQRINEMLEKQMIFNNYIYLLENFYKEVVDLEVERIRN